MSKNQTLEKRINQIYAQASKELTEKVDSFFADFERMDKKKTEQLKDGKITEEEYKTWRRNKILRSKDFEALRDNITDRMLSANKISASYMNGELPGAYTKGFNRVGRDGEKAISGYAFTLINEEAVRRLSTTNKTLLPYKRVDGRKDVRWNTKKVNACVLQGIIQGEPSKDIAKRLMNVTTMNRESAIRNARTALTGAVNHGRLDGMKQLQDDGVILEKEWLASMGDNRTRDAHKELHGVKVPIDKPFENEIGQIMYPGDPEADPANVYNCRCSIATVIRGFNKNMEQATKGEQPVQSLPHPEYGEVFPAEYTAITEQTLSKLNAQYPLDKPLGFVGDVRIHRGYDQSDDVFDMHYNHPEIAGAGAQYLPADRVVNKDGLPSIEIHNELYDTRSLKEEFNSRYATRLKYTDPYEIPTSQNAFFSVSDTLEGTIEHEYAHAIADSWGFFSENRGKGKEVREFLLQYWNENATGKVLAMSKYAATTPDEMWAEAFVQFQDVEHKNTLAYETAEEIMDNVGRILGKKIIPLRRK